MFTTIKCSTQAAMALLGGQYCEIGKMVGVALWSPDTVFSDSFGKTELDDAVFAGKFIGAIMADSLENNDTDPTFKESLLKVRSQEDFGRKGFNLTFEKTPCFHNELIKLHNSTNWYFTPIMDNGSIFAYVSNDGTKRPFPVKMFVGLYKLPILGVEEKGTILGIDLLPKGLNYWQNNGIVLENSEIDFTEVNPVAGLNIEVPILTAGATTTTVKVTNLCSDSVIGGLSLVKWKIEKNGDLSAVTAISFDPEKKAYTLTHAALVAGEKVRFLISENGNNIVAVDTNYYAGSSQLKTVV